jgi:hypothetical protein
MESFRRCQSVFGLYLSSKLKLDLTTRRRLQEGVKVESELDGNPLLPEYTGYIRFCMMMDSYPKAFLALNDQRRAHVFELIRSSWY